MLFPGPPPTEVGTGWLHFCPPPHSPPSLQVLGPAPTPWTCPFIKLSAGVLWSLLCLWRDAIRQSHLAQSTCLVFAHPPQVVAAFIG